MASSRNARAHERTVVARTPYRIGEYLQLAGPPADRFVQCTWCGEDICSASSNWKDHASVRRSAPSQAGPLRVDSGNFFLMEYFCPGCATAIEVEIVYRDDPPLIDRIRSWPES